MTFRALVVLALLAVTAPALAQNASFNLVNRGRSPIRELFVTPAGDANWGQNRLLGRTIAPGGSFLVKRRSDGNCIMDIRAVFADGRVEERKGLNTCNIDAVALGLATGPSGKPADDPSVRLVNRGNQAIVEFFAVPPGQAHWGANRLEAGPLPPATEKMIRIAKGDGCSYDLRVVFADHTAKEKHGTDLCRMNDLPVP